MQLQVNYRCDVCENMIHLDFQKSLEQKKIECNHCGVVYNFSKEDLSFKASFFISAIDFSSSSSTMSISSCKSVSFF